MIESLIVEKITANSSVHELDYVAKLNFLEKPMTFKPGLNIIVGANGSGKSTVLRLLAASVAAKQGGYSKVTSDWLWQMGLGHGSKAAPFFRSVHDGCLVNCFDSLARVGLIGGGFDYDFTDQGISNAMLHASAGESNLSRSNALMSILFADSAEMKAKVAKYENELAAYDKKKTANSKSTKASTRFERMGPRPTLAPQLLRTIVGIDQTSKAAQEYLKGTIEDKGVQTFLLDEIDAHLSFEMQYRMWNALTSIVDYSEKQVIIASHSPFAMNIAGANYIDLSSNSFVLYNKLLLDDALKGFALKSFDESDKPFAVYKKVEDRIADMEEKAKKKKKFDASPEKTDQNVAQVIPAKKRATRSSIKKIAE